MGKSSNSCFRIITCSGGDKADKETDDLDDFEEKSSNDRRGWSFRKKSSRHRVLSNTVVSEAPVSGTTETLGSALPKSPSRDKSEDKNQSPVSSVKQPTQDKTQLPVPVDSKASETDVDVSKFKTEVDCKVSLEDSENANFTVIEKEINQGVDLQESEAHDISIIGKEVDHKVETRGSKAADVIRIEEESVDKVSSKASDMDDVAIIKEDMDLKIKTKASDNDDITMMDEDIDCKVNEEPAKTVAIVIQAAVRGFMAQRELLKLKKVVRLQAAVRGHMVRRHAIGALRCVQAIVKMQALVRARRARLSIEDNLGSVVSEKENWATKPVATSGSVEKLLQNKFAQQLMDSSPKTKPILFKCDPSKPNSAWNWLERWMSVSTKNTSKPNLEEKIENIPSPMELSSNVPLQITDSKSGSKSDIIETLTDVDSRLGQSQQLDVNEPCFPSKQTESESEQPKPSLKTKMSNSTLFATQSKFEMSTSSVDLTKPIGLSYKAVFLGGSEGCTELSVSAPEHRSEAVITKQEHETKLLEQETKTAEQETHETDKIEKPDTDVIETALLNSMEDREEQLESSVVSEIEKKLEVSTPDEKQYPETETGHHQPCPFSPEPSSPKSFTATVLEQKATPASKASSVMSKKDNNKKSGSNQKRMVSSAARKESPSNPKFDLGSDHKSGKRRNSFGFDQEPRESSGGSHSLPRFMQPTESARAKVHEQNSPRSSPDVQDRDNIVKKRHSLPGANGKQSSSPRIQRPMSQAQQGSKEKKWQR